MKINKNSWMVWLIQSVFGITIYEAFDKPGRGYKGKIPHDFCGFSKMFMLALVLAPFCWLSMIIHLIVGREDPGSSVPSWFTPIINLISIGVYHGLFKIEQVTVSSVLIGIFIGSIVFCLFIISFFYLIAGIIDIFDFIVNKLKKYIKNKRTTNQVDLKIEKEPKQNMIITYIKSVKEKYCPKIEFI